MRLFLYEWVTGGGLVGEPGALPGSLLREGLAMVRAVAADAAGLGSVTPVVLRDLRVSPLAAAGAEVIEVASRAERDEAIERLAAECDATIVVAPETDGALLDVVRRVEAAGGRLASPSSAFVAVAADKQACAERLAAAGVPTPDAARLEADAALPADFPYPAVVKPIDGAGSQDTHVVNHAADRPPAYAWPRRLERFVPGVAASVGVLGDGGGRLWPLPACRQRLSSDGRLAYLGGETPLAAGLARRAERLATDAVRAIGPLVGYAGVDLVLGDDPDGAADAVIEINPRLTTSCVGLRRVLSRGGLLTPMLAAARGETPAIEATDRPLGFDADGAVYWL